MRFGASRASRVYHARVRGVLRRALVALVVVISGCGSTAHRSARSASAGTVAAAAQRSLLVPRGQLVGGRTYAQWDTAWWQRSLAHEHQYPSTGVVSRCATLGGHGPVWLLGATRVGRSPVHMLACSVRAGLYLLINGFATECSTIEPKPFFARTDAGLLACARQLWTHMAAPENVSVDGVPLHSAGRHQPSVSRFRSGTTCWACRAGRMAGQRPSASRPSFAH
jgi:hypothetical protein